VWQAVCEDSDRSDNLLYSLLPEPTQKIGDGKGESKALGKHPQDDSMQAVPYHVPKKAWLPNTLLKGLFARVQRWHQSGDAKEASPADKASGRRRS
jgi:hypothetical protein